MKRILVVMCVVLLGGFLAYGQETAPAEQATAPGLENLHVEAGGGTLLPENENSTGLAYGSVNYGFPVSDVIKLGGQIGGRFTLRDHEPEWTASAGIFQREVPIGLTNTTWAIQGVYQNTWRHADLISLKPTFGIEVAEYDYIAVTGVWGINDEHVGPSRSISQQPVDQAMLLWGAEWSDKFRTEIGAGYEFQDLDAISCGGHIGCMLDDVTSLNCTAAADTEGNYYYAVSLGFDLGATGRNATFNNIRTHGGDDYTPFPLGSLPVVFYEAQERCVSEGMIIE